MNQCTQLLAASIIAAMKARADSYDQVASDKATAEANEANKHLDVLSIDWKYVDYAAFYGMTLREAVASVIEPDLAAPVFLLLYHASNDAQAWADSILKPSVPSNTSVD